MLIVLPPSEGKYAPSRGRRLDLAGLSFPELAEARAQVLTALIDLCGGQDRETPVLNQVIQDRAMEVLGLGPTQVGEIERNRRLLTAPTARADKLYTGVLYDALDLGTLDTAAKRRASRRLLITSSVFGVVRPGDRLPSYRLSGGVTLPVVGGIAGHWRRHLDATMRDLIGNGLLVDLRSTTYAAFWRPARDLAAQAVTVRVLHEQNGKRSVVSHFNKATKGRLTRALLESGETPSTPEDFTELLGDLGWHVEADGSRVDVIVKEI
ncbi:MAG TPA: peroxide stress protein YaaA [Marmoricola sp.]